MFRQKICFATWIHPIWQAVSTVSSVDRRQYGKNRLTFIFGSSVLQLSLEKNILTVLYFILFYFKYFIILKISHNVLTLLFLNQLINNTPTLPGRLTFFISL